MEKKIKKEKWEEVFDKLLYKTANNINEGGLVAGIGTEPYQRGTADIKSFISQLLQEQKEEIIEKVKRIKLDMDVVVCDCGEPYKDSDPADLVNELLEFLT